MTALEFADLLNELPDDMLVAAARQKRMFITHNKGKLIAAAACFSLILGSVFTLSFFQKQTDEHLILTQSNTEKVTEIAYQTQVTFESAITSETTALTVNQLHTESVSNSSVTALNTDSGNTLEISEVVTTDDSAQMVTYPQVIASETAEATSDTISITTTVTSRTEKIYCHPYAAYTLPESLCDTIANTIGTKEFCYYMNEPLPVNQPWQKIEIPIITNTHTYLLMYRETDRAVEISLYTNIQRRTFTVTSDRLMESEMSKIATRYGGEVWGGYSVSKSAYEYFLSDLHITQSGKATETELQQFKSQWAWQVASELYSIPETNVQFETEYLNNWNDYVPLRYELGNSVKIII